MKTPPLSTPMLDIDGLVAMQRANVDTLVQAQSIIMQACQVAAEAQCSFLADCADRIESVTRGELDVGKRPQAYVADMHAAAEKAIAVAQSHVDLGIRANAEAIDLLAKRARANVDELQRLAA